tara:strand:- start:2565 stop:5966 length:3402 start_codon:yes stop_codon:yes gene_type:complete
MADTYKNMDKFEKHRARLDAKEMGTNVLTDDSQNILQTDSTAGGGLNLSVELESAADRAGTPEAIRKARWFGGEDANLGNLGSPKLQAFFADSYLNDLTSGVNRFIGLIPDAIVYSGARALGVPEELANKDFFRRVLNAGDYETTEQIQGFFGELLGLQKGQGELVGQTDLAGKIVASAGEMIAMSGTLGGALQTYANKIYGAAVPAIANTTVADNVRNLVTSTLQKFPGQSASIDAGLSAVSGAGGELAADTFGEEYRGVGAITSAFAPIAVFKSLNYAPSLLLYRNSSKINQGARKLYGYGADKINKTKERLGVEGQTGDRSKVTFGEKDKQTLNQIETKIKERMEASDSNKQNFKNNQEEIKMLLSAEGSEEFPLVFSPAESTLDDVLVKTQQNILKAAPDSYTTRYNERIADIANSVNNYKLKNLGIGDEVVDANSIAVFDALNNSYKTQFIVREGKLISTVDDLLASERNIDLLPSNVATGTSIREKILEAKNLALDKVDNIATKYKINSSTVSGDATSIQIAQENIRSALGTTKQGGKIDIDEGALSGINPIVQRFLDFKGKNLTFLDWKKFKMEVSDALGAAVAKGRQTDKRELTILNQELDKTITFGTKGVMNENWKKFVDQYEIIMTPYNQSTVKKVVNMDKGGTTYVSPSEEIASSFLKNTSTAKQYMNLFKDDELAMADITSALFLDMKAIGRTGNSIYKNGIPDPKRINAWLNKNADVINELGLTDTFFGNGTTTIAGVELTAPKVIIGLAEEAANNKAAMNHFANQELVSLLYKKASEKGLGEMRDPSQVVKALLSDTATNPVLLEQLSKEVKLLKNDDYTRAFNSVVMEQLLNMYPKMAADGAESFTAFLIGNKGNARVGDYYKGLNLDKILGEKHVDNLIKLGRIYSRVELGKVLSNPPGLEMNSIIQNIYKNLGTSVPSLTTQSVAAASGRISPRHLFVYLLSRGINEQTNIKNAMLFQEAIINPKVANMLLQEYDANSVSKAVIDNVNKVVIDNGFPSLFKAMRPFPSTEQPANYGQLIEGRRLLNILGDSNIEDPDPEPTIIEIPGFPEQEPDPVPTSEYKNPFLPSEQYAQTRPNVPMPNSNQNATMVSDLFPNDPTSRAIENRRMQGGIGSLA